MGKKRSKDQKAVHVSYSMGDQGRHNRIEGKKKEKGRTRVKVTRCRMKGRFCGQTKEVSKNTTRGSPITRTFKHRAICAQGLANLKQGFYEVLLGEGRSWKGETEVVICPG